METRKVLVGNPGYYYEFGGGITENQLLFLILDLPFGCNLKCLKCYRKREVHFERVDIAVHKRLIQEAKQLGARVVVIPGEGEPLLCWETVRDIFGYCAELGLDVLLYTNGTLLDEDKARFLFDHGVSLIISCDSLKPQTYRTLTGGDVNVVKTNLEMVREIYRPAVVKCDNVITTRLAIITIVQRFNIAEVSELHDWCGDDIFHIVNFPIEEGGAKENWKELVSNQFDELVAIAHQYTDTGIGGLSTPTRDGRCAALYHGLTIDTDGRVLVCPASVNNSVGSIGDADLAELRKRALEFLQSKGCPLCLARDITSPALKNHGIGLTKV